MIEEKVVIIGIYNDSRVVGFTNFQGSDMWLTGSDEYQNNVNIPLYCLDDGWVQIEDHYRSKSNSLKVPEKPLSPATDYEWDEYAKSVARLNKKKPK